MREFVSNHSQFFYLGALIPWTFILMFVVIGIPKKYSTIILIILTIQFLLLVFQVSCLFINIKYKNY